MCLDGWSRNENYRESELVELIVGQIQVHLERPVDALEGTTLLPYLSHSLLELCLALLYTHTHR